MLSANASECFLSSVRMSSWLTSMRRSTVSSRSNNPLSTSVGMSRIAERSETTGSRFFAIGIARNAPSSPEKRSVGTAHLLYAA